MAWRILLFTYTNMDCQQEVKNKSARLAQSVERETFNLRVMGSSPMPSKYFFYWNTENPFYKGFTQLGLAYIFGFYYWVVQHEQ